LGFAPPVTIKQTSTKVQGQIYIHAINWTLMVLSVLIVAGFRSSSAMSTAYGVDIVLNEILCSILFIMVMHYAWKYKWWQCSFFLLFLFIDLSFCGAVISKIANGGWVALLISFFFSFIMIIWYGGEYRLRRFRKVHDTSTRIELLQDRFIVENSQQQNYHSDHFELPPRLSMQSTRSEYQENLKFKLQQKELELKESKDIELKELKERKEKEKQEKKDIKKNKKAIKSTHKLKKKKEKSR